MPEKIVITRKQLARFLPTNELIKAFESLFKTSTVETPTSVQELESEIGSASAISKSALAIISSNEIQLLNITSSVDIPIGNVAVMCDSTSGNITATMPLSSYAIGLLVSISKTDTTSNIVTIQRSGTDLIAGETSHDLLFSNEILNFVSTGTSWELSS